jgi:ABC-type proline/glycine betaine transport system ATPase subunit
MKVHTRHDITTTRKRGLKSVHLNAMDRAFRHKLQDDLKLILAGTNTTAVFSTRTETDVQKLTDRKNELDGGNLSVYD